MNLIETLKGVIKRMIAPKSIESVLHITPTISTVMKDAIELWEDMYQDKSPWLFESNTGDLKSLGIPSLIASEKARTATIEMEIKITGEGERADFMRENFAKVEKTLRPQLEYGIALGGFVIKPYVVLGPEGKYVMEFNYTKASDFYPLSFSPEGKITEAAFVDRIITKDTVYSKVEYHKLEGLQLHIYNYAFKSSRNVAVVKLNEELGTAIPLTEVSAWASITPEVTIDNMDRLLFAYFKMPEANTVDMDSPLGVSGFSRAVDLIRHADELYSNLLWEFEGGQLAIDVDRTALNLLRDSSGKEVVALPHLQDRLYRRNLDLGTDDLYNVFSPQLRDANIINGLNNQLMRIEDACSISRGTLSVVSTSEARTATELKILKQRSFAANQDIQNTLQDTLEAVFDIMDKYCDLYEIVPSGEYEVAYKWDDSIIVDKDTERQADLLDINAGLMSKIEYRMKWYGETEKQAQETLDKINEEKTDSMLIQQEVMMQTGGGTNLNNDNSEDNEDKDQPKSDAEKADDKNKRAQESNETTDKEDKKPQEK